MMGHDVRTDRYRLVRRLDRTSAPRAVELYDRRDDAQESRRHSTLYHPTL